MVVRATLENSGETWLNWLQSLIGIRDYSVRKHQAYKHYFWDEVIKHDKPTDCWIVIHGKVYDVTEWVPKHPGGKVIYDGAGGDCTAVWESYHPLSVLDRGIPQKYLIGEIRDYHDFYSWEGGIYREIKEKVQKAVPRTQRRDDPKMTIKGLFLLIIYFVTLGIYIYFCRWWTAILYGIACSQIGVNIMHDGNHGAFTSSKTLSWMAGYTLDLIGSSSVVYRRSHNYGHHACVNHYELDRSFDTTFPFIRLHCNQDRRWYHKYQHYYALLIYMSANFGDLFGTFDEFFWMSNFPVRRGSTSFSAFIFQIFVKLYWLIYCVLIPSYIHGYIQVFPVLILYFFVFSLGYTLFFAVNHWTLDAGFVDNSSVAESNWAVLQITNSINFALDSSFWTYLTGGLNYQIQHHLFPAMVHTRLPEISPIVQGICKEKGIAYFQYFSFWAALKGHFNLLKVLGEYDNPPMISEQQQTVMENSFNQNRFLRREDTPNVTYLKQDHVGQIVCEGLAALYQAQPAHPLTYLGNWLINYSKTMENKELLHSRQQLRDNLFEKFQMNLRAQQEAQEKTRQEIAYKESEYEGLKEKIRSSRDVDDLLPDLAEHLQQITQATGVYIGLLQRMKRPVGDLDDQYAHQDPDSGRVVRYLATSQNSSFMKDKILKQEEGRATYFTLRTIQKEKEKSDSQEQEEEGKIPITFVKEVVNDPRIKFFDVPKLGSYLCISMTINSCLSEYSFERALENFKECQKKRAERELQRSRLSQISSKHDQTIEQETISQIKEDPYNTLQKKYVVCLDTLGQDRPFTTDQQEAVFEWTKFYKQEWERADTQSMQADIASYIKIEQKIQKYLSEKDPEWNEQNRVFLENLIKEQDPALSEQVKDIQHQKAKFEFIRKKLLDPVVFASIVKLKNFKTVKFTRIFHLLFNLFGVLKHHIVEPGTNLLN